MRPAALALGYRLARLGRLVRKELNEILRDRRTILTLVIMPLLLYPLISIAMRQFFLASGMNLHGPRGYRVGFLDEHEADVFLAMMHKGDQFLERDAPAAKKTAATSPPRILKEKSGFARDEAALVKLLQEGAVDIGIRIPGAARVRVDANGDLPALLQDEALTCELHYKADSLSGLGAITYVERRLAEVNNHALEGRLHLKDVRPKVVLMRPQIRAVLSQQDSLLKLSALVPLVLILMTMTGAVYPAIDLTAGERERGTLEMLIAAPVPRLSLLFAKYVTVVCVATLTALINISAMFSTIHLSGLSQLVFADQSFTPLLIVELLGLLLLFAAFFSAVLLSLTSFARSFKEAQAYLIPLMLVSFLPGMVGMMPGIALDATTMLVPLLNIVLLSRDLLDNQADPVAAVVIIVATILYALAAIGVAARFFGSEAVLYNTQNSWSDLWRRPRLPQPQASVTAALMCLALMLPAWFVLQSIIVQLGLPVDAMLALLAVLSVLLFVGFPLVASLQRNVSLIGGLQLTLPRPPAYAAAVLLGLSAWPWVFQIVAAIQSLLHWRPEELERLVASVRVARNSFPVLMAACVIMQALAEELFFRGFLFRALLAKTNAAATVIVTAMLFGLVHVISGLFIQLVPATLLGLLLGWVCLRTGSVIPGMILHALHNTMMVVVGQSEIAAAQEVPILWLSFGALGTLVGLGLLEAARPRKT